jgi:hypothetical protein
MLMREYTRLVRRLDGGSLEVGVSEIRLVREEVVRLGELARGLPEMELAFAELLLRVTWLEAEMRGDREAAEAALARWREVLPAVERALPAGAGFSESLEAVIDDTEAPLLPQVRTAIQRGMITPAEIATLRAEKVSQTVRTDDPAALDREVELWEQALRMAEEEGRVDWTMPEGVAFARLRRAHHSTGDNREDLIRSAELYERVLEQAAPLRRFPWTRITDPLATAYAALGERDKAISTALTGVRGTAWTALLQNDAADVEAALGTHSTDVVQAARLILHVDPHAIDAALTALESGRGLTMLSARQLHDAGRRLVAAGRADLAREWDRALRDVGLARTSADLRLRVVAALAGVEVDRDLRTSESGPVAVERLLAAPTTTGIQQALDVLEADALIYLVAGDEELAGFALVVPASEPPVVIWLHSLEIEAIRDFEDVVGAVSRSAVTGGTRNLSKEQGSDADYAMAKVCDWAFRTAIGIIFGQLPPSVGAIRRIPRLILIPMQELALIPWHAASTVHQGSTLYALEVANFSYAASARQVVETARRGAVELGGDGLIVGDPDTGGRAADLPFARTEAAAIRDVYYPRARYVGRRSDGTVASEGVGAADEVRAWLAAPPAGSVLHLACHGAVAAGIGQGDSSYLALAGGSRLTAEELVEAIAASGATDAAAKIGMAVLAACSTAVSGRGFDEAFTLGTALLTAGVGSVISAKWPVPDADTSVLMFMVHHFVREVGIPPGDALRAAQIWFLRGETPPSSMPPSLRQGMGLVDASKIVSWAGFVHMGR